MSGFKKIALIAMAAFVLFCAYWAAGRSLMVKTITAQIAEKQSQGYKVVHQGLAVGGFPLKFRARLSAPDIASPRSTDKPWSIKADDWRMEAFSFNPLKWTATHRGEARIDMRGPQGERWLFDARPFNVDVTTRINLDGVPTSYQAIATKLKTQAVIGTLPPIVAIDEATLTVEPSDEDMRYAVDLKNIYLDKDTLEEFQKLFGPRIDRLEGAALARGLKSLDADATGAWSSDGQIIGEGWILNWGGTVFQGGFDLTTNEAGLSGIIRIDVDDINALLSRLEEVGIFSPGQTRNAKLASVLLPVNASGRKQITLTLREGYLALFGQTLLKL